MAREKGKKERRTQERRRGEGWFGKGHQYHVKCDVVVDMSVCNLRDKWLKTYNSTRRKPLRESFEEIIRRDKSFPVTFEEIFFNPRSENLTAEDFEDNGKKKKKKKKKKKQKKVQRADTDYSEAELLAERCRGGSDQNMTLTDLLSLLPNPPSFHDLDSRTEGYPRDSYGSNQAALQQGMKDRTYAENSIEAESERISAYVLKHTPAE